MRLLQNLRTNFSILVAALLISLPVSPAVDNLLPETSAALKRAQELYGSYIRVTSGFRTPEWNHTVGGVPGSYHLSGEAVDVAMPTNPTQLARLIWAMTIAGFKGFGLYDDHCHFDLRKRPTFWRDR